MKKGIDIYDYQRRLETIVESLEKSKISARNKKLILEFRDFCNTDGLSSARIIRYIGVLKDWAVLLGKDFDKATKKDIMRCVSIIQARDDYTAWTKSTYKIMLKRFFKWLKNSDSPEETKWIKSRVKLSDTRLPGNGDLISEKEVKKLVELADNPRDKALISLLYESGMRIGELASLQIGNVKIDEYGAILNATGKTGSRPIRIISSTPYLMAWMNNHSLRNDPKAPLWINIGTTNKNSYMKYATIRNMLRKLFIKAGINKRFNPHMFRHSRATFLADYLTEFQMNQYFGWIQGSNMPSTYVHMSGKRIDASILELNGIQTKETLKKTELKPKICPRCDTINVAEAKFCFKCAGILDLQTACELQEKTMKEKEIRKNSDELLNVLMKDTEFLEVFINKVKELNLAGQIA